MNTSIMTSNVQCIFKLLQLSNVSYIFFNQHSIKFHVLPLTKIVIIISAVYQLLSRDKFIFILTPTPLLSSPPSFKASLFILFPPVSILPNSLRYEILRRLIKRLAYLESTLFSFTEFLNLSEVRTNRSSVLTAGLGCS